MIKYINYLNLINCVAFGILFILYVDLTIVKLFEIKKVLQRIYLIKQEIKSFEAKLIKNDIDTVDLVYNTTHYLLIFID